METFGRCFPIRSKGRGLYTHCEKMRKTSLVVLSLALCPLLLLLPLARTEPLHSRHLDHLDYYERLDYDRGEVHAHHMRVQRSSPFHSPVDPAVVEFTAHGKTFTLLLRPNTAPPPKIHLVGKGGTRRVLSPGEVPNELYQGFLQNDTMSYVHGSLHDGIFDGIIHHGNETYYVEAAWKFFDPLPTTFHSVVYKTGDVKPHLQSGRDQGEGNVCGDDSLQDYLRKVQRSAVSLGEGVAPRRSVRGRSKRATFPPSGNTVCRLRVAVDSRFFSSVGGSSVVTTNNEVANILNEVNTIYSGTDFNFDRSSDGIRFALVVEIYQTASEPTAAFANDNIAVSDFLDLWSQQDHDDFCLALLLTYRDFDGGVLGLAWVAQPPGGNLGGVCEQRARISAGERSLNSAIVTFLNFGRRQTMAVTIVTIAHELGHNFGSNHDPNTAACAPGVSGGGNFIMYFSAVDGSQANNNRFSTCSVADIRPVLESTKSDCFIVGENQCGNGLIEGDEPCDCGSDDPVACDMADNCCTTNCTLKTGNDCSPMTGEPCCTAQCMFDTTSTVCQVADDCSTQVVCNGMQASCPVDSNSFRPDGILCNGENNTCLNGQCTGSVCALGSFAECLCTDMQQLCDICCVVDDVCTTTFELASTLGISMGVFRAPGRTCDNFLGYCADSAPGAPPVCIGVNNDDFLDILRNLFTEETLNNILLWLQTYWYIPVGIIVAITIVVILLPITYRKKPLSKLKNRVNTLRRRASQRSQRQQGRNIQEAQTGGVGRRARGNRRENISNPRRLTESEGVQRVKCFFPHADDDTIRTVMRSKGNEAATVKQLLGMGYPLKKQTVDVLPIHT